MIAPSSNGRTAHSDCVNRGSNPCGAAILDRASILYRKPLFFAIIYSIRKIHSTRGAFSPTKTYKPKTYKPKPYKPRLVCAKSRFAKSVFFDGLLKLAILLVSVLQSFCRPHVFFHVLRLR